jgi:short-subunit dehydrogenase
MSTLRPLAAVTGASAGLGATFARKLAERGYDLLLIARRRDRLEQLAAELPVSCEIIQADLTRDDQLERVAARLREASNLELLVNNAGFGTMGRFFEAPLEGPDAMHRLHVMATMRLTHAALPGMVARRKGGVINVSSVAAFWLLPGSASYCSTKHWINAFSECLYLELKQDRSPVRMQALCPGFTYTEFHDVAKVDRNMVPKSWWLTADYVVEESLKALAKNKLYVVPALKYKILVWLAQVLPRFCRHWLALKIPRRRPKQ